MIDDDGYTEPQWYGVSDTCPSCKGEDAIYIGGLLEGEKPDLSCCICDWGREYPINTPLSAVLNDLKKIQEEG
jgi:hypothetical protein